MQYSIVKIQALQIKVRHVNNKIMYWIFWLLTVSIILSASVYTAESLLFGTHLSIWLFHFFQACINPVALQLVKDQPLKKVL